MAAFFMTAYLCGVALAPRRAYIGAMSPLSLLLVFVATVAAMEGFAYVMHRWVMHGPGWFLHASHHRPRTGRWEANDLYFVIFALPSILLLLGGVQWGWGNWATACGAGIAAYGAIYLGFHDIIVHKRVRHGYVPRSRYMKRIVQAHRLHHAVETKDGTVSFGFLVAPRPAALKQELARRARAGVRHPVSRADQAR
jgi:beta-carotene 3-hydroxylase